MKPPASKTALWSLLAAVFCICAIWVALHHGRGPIPLSKSPLLRDVVEPISVVDAVSADDGGSQWVRFRDARGTIRSVGLIVSGFENDRPPPVLSFGGDRVTRSSVDERALLGLLERWAADDLDAVELQRRYDLIENGLITIDDFWAGLSPESSVKETAVSILRKLRARN